MAVSAVVKDGEIQQTAAETSAKKATKSNSGIRMLFYNCW